MNAGSLIARQLAAEGIDTIFAVVAGPMVDVLAEATNEGIRVINCRHEEQAAFMAQSWGYILGKPGVVVVGSGPGMTNTTTGMYVAQENGWPLVVLGGSTDGKHRGLGGFQEAPQVAVASPVCKWGTYVDQIARIPEVIHLALGKAVSGRPGSVYVDFPAHIMRDTIAPENVVWGHPRPSVYQSHPDQAGVEAIAGLIAGASRPLIVIGKGAAWANASGPLTQLVDLGIPFIASPMGRGTVPDDHPMCMSPARSFALANADAIVMVGGRFNWMFRFGRAHSSTARPRIAQIDIVAEEFFSGAAVDVGLQADCAAAAHAIFERLKHRALDSRLSGWVEALEQKCNVNRANVEMKLASDRKPISLFRLWGEVRDCLPRDATIVVDGEITLGVGRIVMPSYLPKHRLNSGTTGCMGVGVPYAIAAHLARPEGVVAAVVGDYAFGASAAEVETAARIGAKVTFIVANNAGIVGHLIQDRNFPPGAPPVAALLPARYDMMAEVVGGYGKLVEDPAEIRPALLRALNSGTVAVVNIMVDPKETIREGSNYLMAGPSAS